MRNPMFVAVAIAALLLNACGRVTTVTHHMSEDQALETLMGVPSDEGHAAIFRGRTAFTSDGLRRLIEQLIASGQIKVPSGMRGATGTGADLSQLTNLFSLLQGGQANSIMGLANGLLALNGGNSTATTGGLSGIMQILNAALPIIAAIAPQYAGIVQALVVIIPIVTTFIGLFKKKSAMVYRLAPVC